MALYGRELQRAVLRDLLEGVRDSRSGVMVLRGAAGVGKSALIEDAVAGAAGLRVLRVTGVKSEGELAFAGLHQLLWPLRALLEELPPSQSNALRGALGLAAAPSQDPFLIGVGSLALLAAAAEERPTLCVVDDAQWLDGPSAAVLTFVARRLHAEPIGLLFAVRDGEAQTVDTGGLPELRLGGLEPESARALLGERVGDEVAPSVRDRLIELAQGNPLALLELPLALANERSWDWESRTGPVPLTPAIEDAFLTRVRTLSEAIQRLLLVAAADDSGDPAIVLAAATALGIGQADIEAAEATGLLRLRLSGVTFRHPLVRSAVYMTAQFSERARVHRALAETPDPDRRAWHLAASVSGPDDAIADQLQESADRARSRGGFGAAATALRRASSLTTDQHRRVRRLSAAAEAAWLAGRPALCATLLREARGLPADPDVRAELDYLHALIEIADATPADAYRRLTLAVDTIAPADPSRAEKLLLQAREAAVLSGDTHGEAWVCRQAERLVSGPARDPFAARFLGGMAHWLEADLPAAVSRLRDALEAVDASTDPRRLFWAGLAAFVLGDDLQTRQLFQREVHRARSEGAVAMVAQALTMLASSEHLQGRAGSARANATEGLALAHDTAQANIASFHLATLARIAASYGAEEEVKRRVAESSETVLTRRLPLIEYIASIALGEMELAQGRPDLGLECLRPVAARGFGPADPLMRLHAVPAFVEASVRCGQRAQATEALGTFQRWFAAADSPPNLAMSARMHGLLADDASAGDGHFEKALRIHAACERPFEHARTELSYGESLRRRRARREARWHLRAALAMFERVGAHPWAERARNELRASGETVRHREHSITERLSPQELQVARFVATGATSKDIAAQLFLSPRTIDAHLRSIFSKLGIASRAELRDVDLGDGGEVAGRPRSASVD